MHSRWLSHEAGRENAWLFEESKCKIYLDLFNTSLVTTWFHMCYFIVLMSSLLFYNVENGKNKEQPFNE
jgi:hypothetical protein